MGTRSGWWLWPGAVGLALALGGCATDRSASEPPPPIMEPGIGGAGQAGVPAEQVPAGTGSPQEEARPPEPSAPAPAGPPEDPPPPRPPDVAPRPAGGEEFDPVEERPSGEDRGPDNIRLLD